MQKSLISSMAKLVTQKYFSIIYLFSLLAITLCLSFQSTFAWCQWFHSRLLSTEMVWGESARSHQLLWEGMWSLFLPPLTCVFLGLSEWKACSLLRASQLPVLLGPVYPAGSACSLSDLSPQQYSQNWGSDIRPWDPELAG